MDTVNDLMSCGAVYFWKWEDTGSVIPFVLIVIVYSNASSCGTVFRHNSATLSMLAC